MWPTGLYFILAGMGWGLAQQAPLPTVSWEQVGVIGILMTMGGLLMAGKLRLGSQVDGEQKILNGQIDELKKQVLDGKADGDKRLTEYVAQSNQRLTDTITEWRARYAELGQDRDFWRQNALKPVEAVERLTDVVEALKKELEHNAG